MAFQDPNKVIEAQKQLKDQILNQNINLQETLEQTRRSVLSEDEGSFGAVTKSEDNADETIEVGQAVEINHETDGDMVEMED